MLQMDGKYMNIFVLLAEEMFQALLHLLCSVAALVFTSENIKFLLSVFPEAKAMALAEA